MNVKSFCIDHPAATLLLALFIVCGAVSISAMWSDLPHQALVSSLTALLSLVLLRLALFGGLRKISVPNESARTAVGVGVVCAGLAGGAASLFFLLLAEHTAFLEIGTDLLSAVVRVLLVLIVCLGTGVYEEALFRGIAIPCLMCAFAPVGDDSRARDGFPSRRTGTEYTALRWFLWERFRHRPSSAGENNDLELKRPREGPFPRHPPMIAKPNSDNRRGVTA